MIMNIVFFFKYCNNCTYINQMELAYIFFMKGMFITYEGCSKIIEIFALISLEKQYTLANLPESKPG